MKRIFITGATGYIGRQVARRLLADGREVAALVRPGGARRLPEGAEAIVGGLLSMPEALSAAAPLDAVVHCAMEYDERGEENWIADRVAILAASGLGVPFLYTSSLFEAPAADGTALREHPLDGPAPRATHERHVLAACSRAAVIRLGFVWGGCGQNLPQALADAPLPGRRDGHDPRPEWPLVHIEDVADLYWRILTKQAVGVFHAADGTSCDPHDLATRFRGRLPPPAGLFTNLWRRRIVVEADRGRALGWSPRHFGDAR